MSHVDTWLLVLLCICRLTSGQGNLLLHYIHLEAGRGLMLCPAHTTPPTCVQSELLKTFQQTCSVVRKVIRGGVVEGGTGSQSDSESDDWDSEEEEEEEEEAKKKIVSQPFAPKASSVHEHGVMFRCTTRSLKTVALQYWVIGWVLTTG